MLVKLGQTAKERDLVDLLLECHQRIRDFVRLAEAVGRRDDAADAEVIDACLRCERYFTEALPLHVRDEEDSLLPRLRGHEPRIDEALVAMHRQHDEHEALLCSLLGALRAVRESPLDRPRRVRLASAAEALALEFEAHLRLEENEIFPLVRGRLSAREQAEILNELRARR